MTIQKATVDITYSVELTWDDSTDAVSRMLTEDWQSSYWKVEDERTAIAQLASLLLMQGRDISNIDGWADLPSALERYRQDPQPPDPASVGWPDLVNFEVYR